MNGDARDLRQDETSASPGTSEGEAPEAKPRPRTAKQYQRAVDEAIQEALSRGDFDDLPGKGKPLNWETGADDENWLAQHMLHSAGYVPAWIQDRKTVQRDREALFQRLERFRAWAREARAELPELPPDQAVLRRAEISREAGRREEAFREEASTLNRRINSVNLSAPNSCVHERRIAIDEAVARFRTDLAADADAEG